MTGAILSIQSAVAYGHVGNSAAVFPLQRLGMEVWPVDTVQFSNHPGYGGRTGQVFTGEHVRDVVAGIAARGVLGGCRAVLSGYLGDPAVGEAVLDAVALVREANPAALYCCDPVIGDAGPGIYVQQDIPALLRDCVLPQANIATPNQFELELLTGLSVTTLAEAKVAAAALRSTMQPGACVLVTSLAVADTPDECIDLMAADPVGTWRLRTPRLPIAANGTGDTIAALFLLHSLRTRSTALALAEAASALFGLLSRTLEAGSRELLTVAAQDEFVSPSRRFTAEAA
ncbi:pyridoxal kinase PdxY [Acidisphaera sp. L21]|uniref:pyridoxal kinase PdxY n=1 Tax=Acidisphaera sp. L21 TaxID=1641851 RepID=UPI001C203ED4|nr:pyridoxal kinase PdxY [Acidisphaera sp. L21]